jgi:hypothetical protein
MVSDHHGIASLAKLEGIVKDGSGAVIQAAAARIISTGTNSEVQVQTDSNGRFLAPALQPGTYSLMVESAGFKRAERIALTLQVNQSARIEIVYGGRFR